MPNWAKIVGRTTYKIARDEALARCGPEYKSQHIYYQTARTSHGNIVLLLFVIRTAEGIRIIEFQKPLGKDQQLELINDVLYKISTVSTSELRIEQFDILAVEQEGGEDDSLKPDPPEQMMKTRFDF